MRKILAATALLLAACAAHSSPIAPTSPARSSASEPTSPASTPTATPPIQRTLALGENIDLYYENNLGDEALIRLGIASLEDVRVDGREAAFITIRVTALDGAPQRGHNIEPHLSFYDASGDILFASLASEPPCEMTMKPEEFPAGASYTSCITVPGRVETITFTSPQASARWERTPTNGAELSVVRPEPSW